MYDIDSNGTISLLTEYDIYQLKKPYPELDFNIGDAVIQLVGNGYADYTFQKIKWWKHHGNGMVCYGFDDFKFNSNKFSYEVFRTGQYKLNKLRNDVNFYMSEDERDLFFKLLWSLI